MQRSFAPENGRGRHGCGIVNVAKAVAAMASEGRGWGGSCRPQKRRSAAENTTQHPAQRPHSTRRFFSSQVFLREVWLNFGRGIKAPFCLLPSLELKGSLSLVTRKPGTGDGVGWGGGARWDFHAPQREGDKNPNCLGDSEQPPRRWKSEMLISQARIQISVKESLPG